MKRLAQIACLLLISGSAFSQPYIADKIVGVVGKSNILYSDIEEQYMQMTAQGQPADRCAIFEDLLAQKLLVTQAQIDSIEVGEGEVELELEQRITYFVNQIGSEEKLQEYFGKSIIEIKSDMREAVREQQLMNRMQQQIIQSMSITPSEVKAFYKNINKDSVPYIESELEVSQILIYPKQDEQAIFEVRERLLNIRERIINGENFATLAALYSEGPSSIKGGDIGWAAKADLDPAYSKAAFALKKGQVSKIVESSFGLHIIELLDKTEDRIKTRHILMTPKVSPDAKSKSIRKLDSIARIIRLDSLSFKNAAIIYSYDEDSRMSGGVRVNPKTQTTKFLVNDFTSSEYYIIRRLEVGEISEAFETKDNKGKTAYKVVQLTSKSKPHKANLEQDFTLIKNMALQKKQSEVIDIWVEDKVKDTYTKIDPAFKDCNFRIKAWNNK